MPELSVITPIRTESFDFYRQRLTLRSELNLAGVETIVVDDGSPLPIGGDIREFCEIHGFSYLRINSQDVPFSLARARNFGIKNALSKWVYMDDADMVYHRCFFQSIIEQLSHLGETPFSFISLPAVYLSRNISSSIVAQRGLRGFYRSILNSLLLEDPKGSKNNSHIDSFAPASGIIALDKGLALSIGGYDENFSGWGGEDRDFIFRLLCENKKIKYPANFGETKSWNLNDTLAFEGWRALHRLHGEFMARQGLYAFHLYHDRLPWRGDVGSAKNMKMAASKAKAFDEAAVVEDGRFDLRYTVLFDSYRCYDLLEPHRRDEVLARSLSFANKLRDKAQGKSRPFHRKMRKLFISPLQYFEDSGSPLLVKLARMARRK